MNEKEPTEVQAVLNRAFDALEEGVTLLDSDGVIRYMNRRAASFFGVVGESAVGKHVAGGLNGDGLAETRAKIGLALRERSEVAFEAYLPDSRQWVATRLLPDASGLLVLQSDATSRRMLLQSRLTVEAAGRWDGAEREHPGQDRTEEAVRRNEERFRLTLNATPVTVWTRDLDLRYTWITGPIVRGVTAETVLNKRDTDLMPVRAEAEAIEEVLRNIIGSGEGVRREVSFTYTDGVRYYFELAAEPLLDSEDRIVGVMGATYDITNRKKMELELRELNARLEQRVAERTAELEQRNHELQQFAFVASHDLQEPLRKLQTFTDMFRQEFAGQLGEEAHFYLDRIGNAANRMSHLLNDLLTFSRVITQSHPFAPVRLREVVDVVLDDVDMAVCDTAADISIAGDADMEADIAQVRQLLTQLLLNAMKFRRQGVAPAIRVSIEDVEGADLGEPERRFCRIVVEDNGIGFEPRYADRIFEPFERLHGRAAYPGTGMGLAICRRIVERHGGLIRAEGFPDEGSRFTVLLPLNQPVEADAP